MKREIKFRGKRVDNGEWVYGDLIHGVGPKAGKMYILPLFINLAYLPGCHHLDGYEVIPETVGQFTGRKDKNGNKIYEGDVLQTNYCEGVITWFWDGWHIKTGTDEYHTLRTAVHSFQIIGNIHS
jgi:uncharacterized phage protein (TIGR01671 family)